MYPVIIIIILVVIFITGLWLGWFATVSYLRFYKDKIFVHKNIVICSNEKSLGEILKKVDKKVLFEHCQN